MTDLVVLEKQNVEELFLKEGGLNPLLTQIKEVAEKQVFDGDINDKVFRKSIKDHAKKVTSSKTFLVGVANEVTEAWRQDTKKVNAQRDNAKSKLDALRDSILAPVKEHEDKIKEQEKQFIDRIEKINLVISTLSIKTDKNVLEANLAGLNKITVDDTWGELEAKGYKAKDLAVKHITEILSDKDVYDADQKELAELREFKAQKAIKEKADADQKIKDDKETQDLKDRLAKSEQDKEDAVNREAKAKEQAEIDKKKEEERLEQEIIDNAKKLEDQKIKEEQDKKDIEEKKAKEVENRKTVHNNILKVFIESGMSEEEGKCFITLVAKGKIPHVAICYDL